MRSIFIGSSSEAYEQAEKVADLLPGGVNALLWRDAFKLGEVTFAAIERIGSEVIGAIFLATPDDESRIRNEDVVVPRANVLFEYGHLTSKLSRARVALCLYEGVTLPSDLAGVTCAYMGQFVPLKTVPVNAADRLKKWAAGLPKLPIPQPEPEFDFPAKALESKQQPLSESEVREARASVQEWKLQTRRVEAALDGIAVELVRTFIFEDFEDAMRFMKHASRLFTAKKHHPDWENVWVSVRVRLTSWDSGHRLTADDFALAAELDDLYERRFVP